MLHLAKFPDWVCRYFDELYKEHKTELRLNGRSCGSIVVGRGVRQGGTESAIFFTVATDPLVRVLANKCCCNGGLCRVFVDDTCLGATDIRNELFWLGNFFGMISVLIGLELNVDKCVFFCRQWLVWLIR